MLHYVTYGGNVSVPRLSHLQFLVVGIVRAQTLAGREIREQLRAFNVRKSGPAFYQLMARLEDSALVEGTYHQEIVEGQIIRERTYRLRGTGRTAWNQCRKFNETVIAEFGTSRA